MKIENKNIEYEIKRIEHYSLTEMIHTLLCGGAGMLSIEKFVEGQYVIGIVSATFSAACGLGTYFSVKNINKDAEELGKKVNFYRNIATKMPSKKTPEDCLEEICEENQGAKVLLFRRTLRRKNNENPNNPAA